IMTVVTFWSPRIEDVAAPMLDALPFTMMSIFSLGSGVLGKLLSGSLVSGISLSLVTITVYVLVMVPSCAVTTIVIGFWPSFSNTLIGLPLVAAVPFTVKVAVASATTGVTSMLVTAFP